MPSFKTHTKATAPEGSKAVLPDGFIPNLHALMAEAPQLLIGYKALWDLLPKTSLTPLEQQVVMMTANFENNCEYCVPWHTLLMKSDKMPEDVIEALRNGTPLPDEKLQALHDFTKAMLDTRGHVGDERLEAFLAAGYDQQAALEVVLGLAVKLMSNFTNAMAKTPLDQPPQKYLWKKPE